MKCVVCGCIREDHLRQEKRLAEAEKERDEAREALEEVAAARKWIADKTGVGGGTRPLSFLTTSHDYMACERHAAEERAASLWRALHELLGIIDSEPRMSGLEVLTFCGSPSQRTRVMQQARATLRLAEPRATAPKFCCDIFAAYGKSHRAGCPGSGETAP